MDKINFKNYCDKEYEGRTDPFFQICAQGSALFCGVAYPTADSRSYAACEKALAIGSSSFLRRPSLRDEAVNTISGFINEGLYALQDPGKPFFCSLAVLYCFRGRVRWMVSGDASVWHFQDGRMARKATGHKEPLLGKRICWNQESDPEFDISHGSNAFLLYSGTDASPFSIELPETACHPVRTDDAWLEAILSGFRGKACSSAAFILPERKVKWFRRNK